MDNIIMTFVISFIVICFIGYLIKTSMKLVIAIVSIMVLFGAGYVWGSNDFNEKLGLDKWLQPEYSQKVNDFAQDLEAKRIENGVLQQDEVKNAYNKTDEKLKEQSNSVINNSGSIMVIIKDKALQIFNEIKNAINKPATEGAVTNSTDTQTTSP